jgi:hypothetical protein
LTATQETTTSTTTVITPTSRPDGVTIIAILSILAGIGAFFLGAIGGAVGVGIISISFPSSSTLNQPTDYSLQVALDPFL